MKAEIARRQSLTDALAAFVIDHPGAWLTMRELAEHGGFGGWRTRLSDLRLTRNMHIEWNGHPGAASRHRYLPYVPLARDASEYTETLPLPLFEGAPR